jgi:integrase
MRRVQAKAGRWWVSDGTPLFPRNVSRRFHQLLDAAEIDRRGMHPTRHTTATLLLAANEHPKVVQDLLGHSQISLTLDTYSHVMPGMREAAASKLARLLTPTTDDREAKPSR